MYTQTTAPGKVYRIYTELGEFLHDVPKDIPKYKDKKTTFLQIGAGFDIETTLIKRYSFMYHGQFSLGDQIYLFRTWYDFEQLHDALQKLCRKHKAKLMIWVANLGYEFSYICRRIKISRVFAREERHPLSVTAGKLLFRDCLSISGQGGLANLAKNYCTTKKLKGDLDYSVIRNSHYVMDAKSTAYCINDVAILTEWSEYCFNRWVKNGQGHIPMTLTGICREEVKKAAGKDIQKIRKLIHQCFPKNASTYNFMMEWLFRGGFTHANIVHVGREVENVVGTDITSSYPSQMLHFSYPISPFISTEIETDGVHITDSRIKGGDFACWMIVEFYDIEQTTFHSIESKHKIIEEYQASYDNGRLQCARYIRVAITEIDYDIYCWFYRWKKMHIVQANLAQKGPLPNYLIKPLMEAYQTKQKLKRSGQDGTPEYKNAKTIVNSFYGMCVTRLCFTDWMFDVDRTNAKGEPDTWYKVSSKKPYWQMIKDQILLPQWGIWITAYARYVLLSIVHAMDHDKNSNHVVYCDTDSIYFTDCEHCRKIIDYWNKKCRQLNWYFPEEFDDIGCFDYLEGGMHYRFKTLGAKRYIKLDADGNTTVTVAGMRVGTYERAISTDEPPESGDFVYVDVMDDDGTKHRRFLAVDDFFDRFDNMFLLSAEQSCKLAALYHDSEYSAMVDGEEMHELSGCALVNITFRISLDRIWLKEAYEIQRKLRREELYD